MPQPMQPHSAFATACRHYRKMEARRPKGNAGCLTLLAAGVSAAVLCGHWTGGYLVAGVLSFVLPMVFGMVYLVLLDLLYTRAARQRVQAIIKAHIAQEKKWQPASTYLTLCTHALPRGNWWNLQLNLETGQYYVVKKVPLDQYLESESEIIEDAIQVINGFISQNNLDIFKDKLSEIPPMGTIGLKPTVKDGMPFNLEIFRGMEKRTCHGNLGGLPPDELETPEVKMTMLLMDMIIDPTDLN